MGWQKAVLLVTAVWGLTSCGDTGEDKASSNVTVALSSTSFPLIPAPAYSALAERKGAVSADISASYFRIPKITFTRKDTTKTLVIAFLRIKIALPSGSVLCEVGGDSLSALADSWWTGGREASISIGVSSFSTDRPLYCGGIAAEQTFTASGTMDIYGLERNETSLEEVPVKTTASVTIQSY